MNRNSLLPTMGHDLGTREVINLYLFIWLSLRLFLLLVGRSTLLPLLTSQDLRFFSFTKVFIISVDSRSTQSVRSLTELSSLYWYLNHCIPRVTPGPVPV